jgi:glycosyltransferase involved in cell wall biosynthesis
MRIAFLNNHYQLGGAETVVRQLHYGMLEHGIESRLLVTEGKAPPRRQGVIPLYPRLLSALDHSRFKRIASRIAPRRKWTDRTIQRLAQSKYDLIHIHSFHGLYASLQTFAELAHAKPVVWTFHRFWGITGGCDHPFMCKRYLNGCGSCPQVGNFAVGETDHTAEEWAEKMRLLRNLPLTVISPSHHLAEVVRQSPIGMNWETVVIHNGINTKEFDIRRKHNVDFRLSLSLQPNKLTLLFTNRNFQDPIKGWPVVREALRHVSSSEMQLILVGEGSTWAASQLPDTWDVVDLGYVADRTKMASIYEAADIFLYASEGENFPCAIIEAMSSGCCIVSTSVDGVLEQVEPGQTGLIADGVDGQSLARCLANASANPQRILEIGQKARIHVSTHFSEEQMVTHHLDLYKRVLGRQSYIP